MQAAALKIEKTRVLRTILILTLLAVFLGSSQASADQSAQASATVSANIIMPLKWQLLVEKIQRLQALERGESYVATQSGTQWFILEVRPGQISRTVSADGVPTAQSVVAEALAWDTLVGAE